MLKLFLTGDNHIGLRYTSHEQAATLAAARIAAFEGMVAAANRENCDLFVIAGDLFENTHGISQKDIRALLDTLSHFHGTVVVLPGNHDYYDRDVKLWQHFRELAGESENILLLTDYRPYALCVNGEEVVLYPALCTSCHSALGQNNLDWIKASGIQSVSAYRIGIAHGAIAGESIDKEGQYFQMTHEELAAIPVDVWLIGHMHVPFPRDLTEEFTENGRIFNAGTHVQTDVSCNSEGLCFIIAIDADKTVRAKKFPSGDLHFYRRTIALEAGEMEEILRRELADIVDKSVVDVILTGAVTIEEYEERASIIESVLSRFLEGTYNDYVLSKRISEELIRAEFPETSFSAGFLTALLDEPKEAQLAYELLQSLQEE